MCSPVVVPTYKEADNIGVLLRRVRGAAPWAGVVVVDDGGADRTADVAEAVGAEVGGVEVLRRTAKQGIGPAYRAGFAHTVGGA